MLNFKDWKLASSTNEKATLRHAMGHEMTIAVKALPKIQREQIMRLAKIQQYSEGSPETVQPDSGSASDATDRQPAAAPAATHITINAGGGQQPAQQSAPAPAPAPQSAPATPQVPTSQFANQAVNSPAPQVKVPAGPRDLLNANGQPNPAAIQQAGQAAAQGQSQIDAAKAKALVPAEQAHIAAQANIQDRFQKVFDQLQNETNKFSEDTNGGEIDPQRWWKQPGIFGETGAPKKALSAIGLVLGGLGAGQLGSTDNPALRALNAQIDRDIDAQQKTFGNKRTILGAYQDLYGHGLTATNMAKNALAEIYKSQIDLVDKQLGTPQSKVNALKYKADISQDQLRRNKESATDITQHPGFAPSYQDTSAANTATPVATPGQHAQKSAQAAPMPTQPKKPLAEREFVDAEGAPVKNSIVMAGINPDATDEELQEKGIYPKENPRSAQMKEITKREIPPLLREDADKQMNKLQYDTNKLPFANDINTNFKNAKFIDQNMKKMNGLYSQAIDAVEKAGVTGRIRDAGSSVVGGIAGAVGSLFGHGAAAGSAGAGAAGALDTRLTRLRDNALEGLESVINASLNGVKGVDSATVHRWVQGAKPVYGDTPNDIRQKFDNLIDLVKGHAAKDHIGHLLR